MLKSAEKWERPGPVAGCLLAAIRDEAIDSTKLDQVLCIVLADSLGTRLAQRFRPFRLQLLVWKQIPPRRIPDPRPAVAYRKLSIPTPALPESPRVTHHSSAR
jgi:hypothetical protein